MLLDDKENWSDDFKWEKNRSDDPKTKMKSYCSYELN